MQVTIYHNPRCSKSRQTLQLLRDRGIDPVVVKYLESPPSTRTITWLLKLLDKQPRELMRVKEAEYKQQDLANPALSKSDLVEAIHDYPKLLERPIVVVDNERAAIGRPPESVLDIL